MKFTVEGSGQTFDESSLPAATAGAAASHGGEDRNAGRSTLAKWSAQTDGRYRESAEPSNDLAVESESGERETASNAQERAGEPSGSTGVNYVAQGGASETPPERARTPSSDRPRPVFTQRGGADE